MKRISVFLFILVLITNCLKKEPTAPETGTVSVTVFDSEGIPLEGVKVILAEYTSHTQYTNSSGECTFQDIPTILCVIHANKSRFSSASKKINVKAGKNSMELTLYHQNPYFITLSYGLLNEILADTKRKNLYVTDDYSNTIAIIDIEKDTISGYIELSNEPVWATISSDNDYLFVSEEDYYLGGCIEKIDLTSQSVAFTKETDFEPYDIEFGANLLFVSPDYYYYSDSIMIMDTESLGVVSYITGGNFENALLEIDTTENMLYAGEYSTLYKCSIDSGIVVDTISFYYSTFYDLTFDEERKLLFVATYYDDEIIVIDTESFEITHTIYIDYPTALTLDEENKRLFALTRDYYEGCKVVEYDSLFIERKAYALPGVYYGYNILYLPTNNRIYGLVRDYNYNSAIFVLLLDA
ncbi:MAG: hypothetical protein E3J87_08250 [Candidatus Cloacimonadota bacterium]|nr:MAG: hypothetical protein E3J87_08250 [Candidatus Cloacimonadota bacterium]